MSFTNYLKPFFSQTQSGTKKSPVRLSRISRCSCCASKVWFTCKMQCKEIHMSTYIQQGSHTRKNSCAPEENACNAGQQMCNFLVNLFSSFTISILFYIFHSRIEKYLNDKKWTKKPLN